MEETKNARHVVSAKISAEAAEGWRRFCESNGVSLTAMIEVAGISLAGESTPPVVPERIRMVEQARMIDIQRRARRPS